MSTVHQQHQQHHHHQQHRVRAYTFDFCCFLSVAYTLNKLFAVFLCIIFAVLLKNL